MDWFERTHAANPALTRIVAAWLRDVLCDDDAPVDGLLLVGETGHRRYVSRVPGTDVDVTWFEAAPFMTMKILWIEVDEG
jgi:hypothetical protein